MEHKQPATRKGGGGEGVECCLQDAFGDIGGKTGREKEVMF